MGSRIRAPSSTSLVRVRGKGAAVFRSKIGGRRQASSNYQDNYLQAVDTVETRAERYRSTHEKISKNLVVHTSCSNSRRLLITLTHPCPPMAYISSLSHPRVADLDEFLAVDADGVHDGVGVVFDEAVLALFLHL